MMFVKSFGLFLWCREASYEVSEKAGISYVFIFGGVLLFLVRKAISPSAKAGEKISDLQEIIYNLGLLALREKAP